MVTVEPSPLVVVRGVAVYSRTGSRSVMARSSSQRLPRPPVPAVIAISIAAARASVPPPRCPQANVTLRRGITSRVHSPGGVKLRRTDHHTFGPDETVRHNSSVLDGALPRTQADITEF